MINYLSFLIKFRALVSYNYVCIIKKIKNQASNPYHDYTNQFLC